MTFIFPIILSLGLLVLIVIACQLFTNAIEWLGHRFNLSDGIVGSVFAAVGTALPETIVPIVALISGSLQGGLDPHAASDIGIGAILGAPFLLSTLGMFVIGMAAFYYGKFKKSRVFGLHFDPRHLSRDTQHFYMAYGLVLIASFVHIHLFKYIVAITLVGLYAWYILRVVNHVDEEAEDSEIDLEPLYFQPKSSTPKTGLIALQILVSLLAIIILAHLFVNEVNHFSMLLGLPALVVSLILTPIATEMPEKFNSFIWVGREKDTLALGNITGAKVFQSTIPAMVGLLFTPWILDKNGLVSVVICILATISIETFCLRAKPGQVPYICLLGGAFYAAFLWIVLCKPF